MSLLLESDFPNKHRDFQAVLADENEPPEIRHLAARFLGMTNTAASLEILVQHCRISDEFVLAGIMQALGGIGNEAALDAVVHVQKRSKGALAARAGFAAALIAHRHGLKDHSLCVPNDKEYCKRLGRSARPLKFGLADSLDAEACLRSLAHQPFGIEFAEHPMYQIRCGRNIWMLLWNRDSAGPNILERFRKRKTFLGIVARRSSSTGLYGASFVILTSPSSGAGTVGILVHRLNGSLVIAGRAELKAEGADFSLRSVENPRGFEVQLEGEFRDGIVKMKSALSTESGNKQQLNQEVRPGRTLIEVQPSCASTAQSAL